MAHLDYGTGFQDGLISNQKYQFWVNLGKQGCQMVHLYTQNPNTGMFREGLGMEKFGIFYGPQNN
jgi:hypothetical protein